MRRRLAIMGGARASCKVRTCGTGRGSTLRAGRGGNRSAARAACDRDQPYLEAPVRQHLLAPVVALATLTLATPARTQVSDPIPYGLTARSELGYGCAQPCMCAWFQRGPLTGDFALHLTGMDFLYAHYALLDIVWRSEIPDGAGTRTETLKGHGTYDIGGPGVGRQRMQLDLTAEDGFAHHFDSGWVEIPPGPALDLEIPMGHACYDSVLRVVALPLGGDLQAGGLWARLTAAPNPTGAGTDVVIALALPEPVAGEVAVMSATGRTIAVIASGVLPAGVSRWRWDGRTTSGADAGVGVFWVHARFGSQALTHQFVRLK